MGQPPWLGSVGANLQEKEKKDEKKPAEPGSPKTKECSVEKGTGDSLRESKVNGDDHHEEDMDMSD